MIKDVLVDYSLSLLQLFRILYNNCIYLPLKCLFSPPFCPDLAQMQCVRAYVAQQPDELSLEKADVLLVHQDTSDSKSAT